MPLNFIDHYLIQTADLEGTKDWYCDVLGMRLGDNPDFKMPVYWLYLGEKDVLHLTVGGQNVSENRKKYLGQQSTDVYGSGVVDHIAFRCTGLREMMDHLDRKGVEYTRRQVNDQGLFQLFLIDPNGVKVELNYDNAEAKGIRADVMASELSD